MYNRRPSDDDGDERRYRARSYDGGSPPPPSESSWARLPTRSYPDQRPRPPPQSQHQDGRSSTYDDESVVSSSRDASRFPHHHGYNRSSRPAHQATLYHSHQQPSPMPSSPYGPPHSMVADREDGRPHHSPHPDCFGEFPPIHPGEHHLSGAMILPIRPDHRGKSKQSEYSWARQPPLPPSSTSSAQESVHHAYPRSPLDPLTGRSVRVASPPFLPAPPPPTRYPDPYYEGLGPGANRLSSPSCPLRSYDGMMHKDKRQRMDGAWRHHGDFGPPRQVPSSPTAHDFQHSSFPDNYASPRLAGFADRGRPSNGPSPSKAHLGTPSDAVESAEYGLDSPLVGNDAAGKAKRRKRAILSCTECKQRKIKCDRNVPNCGSCVRRGLAHLCRWGDERDNMAATQSSSITPSNAALMAKIAQLESQVRFLQATGISNHESPAISNASEALGKRSQESSSPNGLIGSPQDYRGAPKGLRSSPDGSRFRPVPFTHSETHRAWVQRSGVSSQRDAWNDQGNDREEERAASGAAEEAAMSEDDHSDAGRSENSEIVESGAEDASEVLQALAKGTSLKGTDKHRKIRKDDIKMHSHDSQVDSVRDESDMTISANPAGALAAGLGDSDERPAPKRLGRKDDQSDIRADGPAAFEQSGKENGTSRSAFAEAENIIEGMAFFPELHETRMRHKGKLSVMLRILPSRDSIKLLVELYIKEAEPLVHSLHFPTFWRQLERFWKDVDGIESSDSLPDLQFAALLFALVEGACEYMTPAEVINSGICSSRTDINARLTLLVQCCTSLLAMAGFIRRPAVFGSQAVVALRHYCFNRNHREEYMILSTMAIKAAETVGIHRLGSAIDDERRWESEREAAADAAARAHSRWKILTSTRVLDGNEKESEGEKLDPERQDLKAMWLPRGHQRRRWEVNATKRFRDGSRVHREEGRKLWFAFATMDWQCAAFFDRSYHCIDEQFTTQTPANIEDDELIDGHDAYGNRDDGFIQRIQPWGEPTCNSFIPIHVEICHTVRSIADAMNQGLESYDTVLQIDERFRSILATLPRFFRLDGKTEHEPGILQMHRDRPYLSLQRVVIYEYVHHRLLKLHRLFMGRGYKFQKYKRSTRTCIESARVVIGTLRSLDAVDSRGQRYWIFKFHIFHALLALQVDLMYLADESITEEVESKRADVVAGLKMIHARTDVEGRNPMLASSLKVIKVLREEERARQSRKTKPAASSDLVDSGSASESHSSGASKRRGRLRTHASQDTGRIALQIEKSVLTTWPLPVRRDSMATTTSQEEEPKEVFEGSTELDDYLHLLSTFQNPGDRPGGANIFASVLDDRILNEDLGAAGAGFDSFSSEAGALYVKELLAVP